MITLPGIVLASGATVTLHECIMSIVESSRDPQPLAAERPKSRKRLRRIATGPSMRSYPPVEAVQRALEILRIVNQLRVASVKDIFAATGYPKPTIVRMLETLIADGYVARDDMCNGYRVTSRVQELNAGYSGISLVIEAARPWLVDLTQRLKWPTGIATREGSSLILQFSTAAISPWSYPYTRVGAVMDLIATATGRAYLAFCSDDERELLLEQANLKGANAPLDNVGDLDSLLQRVRRDGYAVRDRNIAPLRTLSLAMPIMGDGKVLAISSISFYRSAISDDRIKEHIVQPLRTVTQRIEDTIGMIRSSGREQIG
jgi:IclR family mhp operon transcriptional activator